MQSMEPGRQHARRMLCPLCYHSNHPAPLLKGEDGEAYLVNISSSRHFSVTLLVCVQGLQTLLRRKHSYFTVGTAPDLRTESRVTPSNTLLPPALLLWTDPSLILSNVFCKHRWMSLLWLKSFSGSPLLLQRPGAPSPLLHLYCALHSRGPLCARPVPYPCTNSGPLRFFLSKPGSLQPLYSSCSSSSSSNWASFP